MMRKFKLAAPRPCAQCGMEFRPRQQDVNEGKGRYCSSGCGHKAVGLAQRYSRDKEESVFWGKVERGERCWIWTGKIDAKGYGVGAQLNRKRDRSHRIAYMIAHGAIPPGMCVCHACDNPRCCSPKHLFLGTLAANNEDMRSKGRHARGEKNVWSKLSETQVIQIRADNRSPSLVARDYGVSPSLIYQIRDRKIWAHLP